MFTELRKPSICFKSTWLAWVALRHFLSARQTRELCSTLVHETSNGQLAIEDLIDDLLSEGDELLESWVIRPRANNRDLAAVLTTVVQRIVWQNDEEIWHLEHSATDAPKPMMKAIEIAFNLGSTDLLSFTDTYTEEAYQQNALKSLVQAVDLCAKHEYTATHTGSVEIPPTLTDILDNVDAHLKIAILKHLGDLFCQQDRWIAAIALYDEARNQLTTGAHNTLDNTFAIAMNSVISQSIANVRAVTESYQAASAALNELVNRPLSQSMLSVTNGALDGYQAQLRSASDLTLRDTRSATLSSPLVTSSVSLQNALTNWQRREFGKARVWFWSALRRQIALGDWTASRTTKGLYAACTIDWLNLEDRPDSTIFQQAVSHIVESESAEHAKRIQWSDQLIDAVVDERTCRLAIEHAHEYEGVRKYRQAVVVELFSIWTRKISADKVALAEIMLNYIVSISTNLEARVRKDGVDLNVCLSAIFTICEQRPEFQHTVRDALADTLANRIGATGYWTGENEAIRLAAMFADLFRTDQLKQVVQAVIRLLESLDPTSSNWVIARPAIYFFGTDGVVRLCQSNPDLAAAVMHHILIFNNEESGGTYAADILQALNAYPNQELQSNDFGQQFTQLVRHALQEASKINSSSSVSNIMALLRAPRAAGREAIQEVANILLTILNSAIQGQAALSFRQAHRPLRYLAAFSQKISSESTLPMHDLGDLLQTLCLSIEKMWETARSNPSIFSPLALLEVHRADKATVHNWAIASFEVAQAVGRTQEVNTSVTQAREQAALVDGISLAFATRHASNTTTTTTKYFDSDGEVADMDSMATESRAAFYAAMGRRLTALKRNCSAEYKVKLVKSVLRHGPRQVDAAVFTSLSPSDLSAPEELDTSLDEYEARFAQDRELLLTLGPLIENWKISR